MKNNLKPLTYGSMIGAIYGICLILIRFLLKDTDSMIYVFLPIPIAIYSYRFGLKNGIITLLSASILSFLLVDIFYALLLVIPNLILGCILGVFQRKNSKSIIFIVILFLISFAFDLAQFYSFCSINAISIDDFYIETLKIFSSYLTESQMSILSNFLRLLIPVVFVVYSVFKIAIDLLLCNFILKRIKWNVENETHIAIKFNLWFSIGYLINFLFFVVGVYIILTGFKNSFFNVIFTILCTIFTLYSLFIFYQGMVYIISIIHLKNVGLKILLLLLILLLFPLTLLMGILSNFLFDRKSLYFYKR